jgi:hypothetical protein
MERGGEKRSREDEKKKKKKLRAGGPSTFLSEKFLEKKFRRLAEIRRLLYLVRSGT